MRSKAAVILCRAASASARRSRWASWTCAGAFSRKRLSPSFLSISTDIARHFAELALEPRPLGVELDDTREIEDHARLLVHQPHRALSPHVSRAELEPREAGDQAPVLGHARGVLGRGAG